MVMEQDKRDKNSKKKKKKLEISLAFIFGQIQISIILNQIIDTNNNQALMN